MMEDFGWSGDEFLIGDCQDDWNMDILDVHADKNDDRSRLLVEDEIDDAWDSENERDLFDIVRAHDEEYGDPDYPAQVGQDASEFDESADDYLNCDWRE